jgi:hypothetical protein
MLEAFVRSGRDPFLVRGVLRVSRIFLNPLRYGKLNDWRAIQGNGPEGRMPGEGGSGNVTVGEPPYAQDLKEIENG